jgi:hypothetical protein
MRVTMSSPSASMDAHGKVGRETETPTVLQQILQQKGTLAQF